MKENLEEIPEQSPVKSDFQLKNEDFPALQSTTSRSRRMGSKKKPGSTVRESSEIINEPSRFEDEPSGSRVEPGEIKSEPIRISNDPSGTMNEPSEIGIEPSGFSNELSEIIHESSGIMVPPARISSVQVANQNIGFIPRFGSNFLESLQPELGRNIPIYPDATVRNIPRIMMTDQFGMLGFLSAYRGMQTNPALATLAIGEDPVNMGLGMNNQLTVPGPSGYGRREIHINYGGPWADVTTNASLIEATIPDEYKTNLLIGDKLAKIRFPMLEDDALFYLFYNFPGEQYQIAAAYELYMREWRYHKVRRIWLKRFDYKSVTEYATTHEEGLYNIFDSFQWRKLVMKLTLLYKDIEKKPTLPPEMRIYFDP